jgi:hypothetical protein
MWTYVATLPFIAYAVFASISCYRTVAKRRRLEREYEELCQQLSAGLPSKVAMDEVASQHSQDPKYSELASATVNLRDKLSQVVNGHTVHS